MQLEKNYGSIGGFNQHPSDQLAIVSAVLLVLVMMLLPAIRRPHNHTRITCVNNLRQIGVGFRLFAADDGLFPNEVPIDKDGTLGYTNSGNTFAHFLAASHEIG